MLKEREMRKIRFASNNKNMHGQTAELDVWRLVITARA